MEKDKNDIHSALNDEDQYIGNIWGWKFSYISLGIILFFMSLMALRYGYLKYTGQWDEVKEKMELQEENQ